MYESNRKGVTPNHGNATPLPQKEDSRSLEKTTGPYSEIADIFPALQKYKEEHSVANLQKLCVEISEFCWSVYASTQSETERDVYRAMVKKLNN